MADYRILVDTHIDTSKLDAFEKKIKNLDGKKLDIKVHVDASDISKQVTSQINKALGTGSNKKMTIRPNVDIDSNAIVKKANDAFKGIKGQTLEVSTQIGSGKEYRDNVREIWKTVQQINRLSINPDANVEQLKEVERYLDRLISRKKIADSNEINIFDGLDTSAAREFAVELEKVEHAINNIQAKNVDTGVAKSLKQQAAETKSAISELQSAYKRMDSLQKQQVKLDVNSSEYKAIDAEINRVMQRATELQSKLSGNIQNSVFDSIAEDGAKARAELDRTIAKLEDTRRKIANTFVNNIKNGSITSDLDDLIDRMNRTGRNGIQTDVLKRYRDELNNADFIGRLSSDDSYAVRYWEQMKSNIDNARASVKAYEKDVQRLNRQTRETNAAKSLENSKNTLNLQIDSWLKTNSAAAADFGDKLKDIQLRIRDCNDSASLSNLRSEFQQVKLEAQIADKATMTFGDRLKNQFRQYASYVGIAGVFAAGSQAVRMMAQNVLEVDTAMTGLYRVTDMTAAQYDKLYSDMIASSKEYGTTLTDTINATSDWVRAGYDADTALQLADITAMYQHISDLDYDEAAENLLTAYNGFKDTFNEEFGGDAVASVQHIADAFNDLDNKYSITSAGLGEGLARSASALQLAGNTFEEAAA